ncbi:MAG: hypothetical protein AAF360_06115, partial [Pseudomonadota bacterium]
MTTLDDAVDIDPTDVMAQIRLDTAARLKPLIAARRACTVKLSPVDKIAPEELPAVAITLPQASYAPVGNGHPRYTVELTLRIFCYVKQADGWDAAADALSHAVMVTLLRDPEWTRGWRESPEIQRVQTLDPQGAPHAVVALDITGVRAASVEHWPRDLVSLDRVAIDIDFADPSRTPGESDGDLEAQV